MKKPMTLPDDFEVSPSGTHRIIQERDEEIERLTAENERLRVRFRLVNELVEEKDRRIAELEAELDLANTLWPQ